MKKFILLFSLICSYSFAQDTIRMGHEFKNFDLLELGTTTDAVYNSLDGKMRGLSLMTKTTELVTIDGVQYLSIKHEWNDPNTEWHGSFEYLCEPKTLRPIQHIRITPRAGKEAFKFYDKQIVGLDSAIDNKQKDFELALQEPTYNWEIDLETYSLLPMKKGYHAVMNFYHPGASSSPNFYHLKVIGSEKIKLPNGKSMDCWIIFTDYRGSQPTRFWYTKKGQNFVKMEGQYNKVTIYKERIF